MITETIIISLIAGFVSFIVALVTAYFTSKLEGKKFNYRLVENLYEKRFETYAKLLEVTQDVGKNAKEVELCKNARKELKEWQKVGGGFLLMSPKTLNAFDILKDALKKEPEKEKEYSEVQRKKIWKARNGFRGALRDEFEFFHSAENHLSKNL